MTTLVREDLDTEWSELDVQLWLGGKANRSDDSDLRKFQWDNDSQSYDHEMKSRGFREKMM